jgi:dTDP-glucose pyrophosphorylase
MAGAGSRFANKGYKDPKPLIPVFGKPMISLVVENMKVDPCRFIFIVQQKHYDEYNLKEKLNTFAPGCEIVITNGITEGAACSVLLAKSLINNNEPLLIANSDQFLEWNAKAFLDEFAADDIDGGISTFVKNEPDTKWSYAKLDDNGNVIDVQEKVPISTLATTGIYYWKKGADFVKYAEQMIHKSIPIIEIVLEIPSQNCSSRCQCDGISNTICNTCRHTVVSFFTYPLLTILRHQSKQ